MFWSVHVRVALFDEPSVCQGVHCHASTQEVFASSLGLVVSPLQAANSVGSANRVTA
jgi:hypothetical protein